MPAASNIDVKLAQIGRLDKAVRDWSQDAAAELGRVAAGIVEDEFARDGVIPRRSTIASATVTWKGVRSKPERRPWGSQAHIKAAPPAHLVNNPTRPHFISGRKFVGSRAGRQSSLVGQMRMAEAMGTLGAPMRLGRVSRRKRRGAANIAPAGRGAGVWRRWAFHPGTSGTGSWGTGRAKVNRELPRLAMKAYTTTVRRALVA